MVKLTKIYTRTGDEGETGLGDGSRTAKIDARVEAYGSVDEANSDLGVAVLKLKEAGGPKGVPADRLAEIITRAQNDLFDVGADLCTPITSDGPALRVTAEQVDWVEGCIDELNGPLPALTSFVLPGGSPGAAALHVARTSCRRAERRVWEFDATHGEGSGADLPAKYLNRLSDLLFVMARVANGGEDVLWVPGANRTG